MLFRLLLRTKITHSLVPKHRSEFVKQSITPPPKKKNIFTSFLRILISGDGASEPSSSSSSTFVSVQQLYATILDAYVDFAEKDRIVAALDKGIKEERKEERKKETSWNIFHL